jgi:DNA mismatch repair protein MLH1
MQIAPHAIDVNVHPTKREVQFLHEEEIVSGVRTALETLLLGANSSRVFQTQQLVLPSMLESTSLSSSSISLGSSLSDTSSSSRAADELDHGHAERLGDSASDGEPRSKVGRLSDSALKRPSTIAPSSMSHSSSSSSLSGSKPKYQPSKLVRTDALNPQGRLDSFLRKPSSDSKSATASSSSPSAALSALDSSTMQSATDEPAFRGFIRKRPSRPPVTLTSVHSLIDAVESASHDALTLIFQQHSFVGCIDDTYCLIQHKTKLYVINVCLLSQSFFYEQVC